MKQVKQVMILFFILMGTAHAGSGWLYKGWHGHFLLGVDGGYAWRDGHLTVNITEPMPAPAVSAIAKDNFDNGFVWGIFAGYQVSCRKLLFGGEIFSSYEDIAKAKDYHAVDTNGDHYNLRIDHERGTVYGFTLRGGYKVLEWLMPYIKAGFETSYEKLYLGALHVTGNNHFALSHERRVHRFIGGAGLEFPLFWNFKFRTEYNWTSRGRGAQARGVEPITLETVNAELKHTQHTAKGSILWVFQ